jgi:XrtJ-associated TM-motif-TM protein
MTGTALQSPAAIQEGSMKFRYGVFIAILLFTCAFALRAQTGCVDSPEDPTIVLGLVGSAAALFSIVRGRLKARRNRAPLV